MTQPVKNKGKPGRPLGFSPGRYTKATHRVGDWAWNSTRLWSKIDQSAGADACWAWRGAVSPGGNLFGAIKNGRSQMTQVNRLLLMEQTGEPINDVAVRMTCQNKYCCNHRHFTTEYNKIWSARDGTPSRIAWRVYG